MTKDYFTDMSKSACSQSLRTIFFFLILALSTVGFSLTDANDSGIFVPVSSAPPTLRAAAPEETAAEIEALAANDDETSPILEEGRALLNNKNWAQARNLFEDGLKKHPDQAEMRRLYLISRAHLEIETRYTETSFCRFLAETNRAEILYLCDETFNNIQTWHVDAPDWSDLFHMGLDSMVIAFSEEAFLRQNRVAEKDYESLAQYGAALREQARTFPVRNRSELKNAMLKVGETVQRKTGVSGISVIMELLCGMVNSLDSYSAWLTRNQIADLYSMIDGHFVGLGVYVEAESVKDALLISKVIVGSPAAEAGLADGDLILSIDGQPIVPEKAGSLLQGVENSRVRLLVRSGENSPREIVVTRRSFDFPSVEQSQLVESENGVRIASFRINAFQKTTVDEVRRELAEFQKQKAQCLVIDLRNNPGGLLDKAVELSNLFLENGTIVRTRGRVSERIERADGREVCRVPLILLIDENSASAAEIFAGAIQENGRGTVVGTRSFGKGTIQAIIQIGGYRHPEPLAGMRLTTEKFYSPRGRAYSGVGVEPDIDIAQRYEVARPENITAAQAAQNPQDKTVEPAEPSRPTDVCMDTAVELADKIVTGRAAQPFDTAAAETEPSR